jgi:hypothetical protein
VEQEHHAEAAGALDERRVPSGDEAVELFRHVVWLTRYENFSELKRDRVELPDLASVRR